MTIDDVLLLMGVRAKLDELEAKTGRRPRIILCNPATLADVEPFVPERIVRADWAEPGRAYLLIDSRTQ